VILLMSCKLGHSFFKLVPMRSLLTVLLATFMLVACSGGGSGNSSTDRVATELADTASAPEIEGGYSMVLGIPFVSSKTVNTIYDDLIKNLNNPKFQAQLPISRVLLSTVAPNINGVFTIDPSNPSLSMTFLQQIKSYNAGKLPANQIQILAYPDVEVDSPWATWTVPAFAQSINSCKSGMAIQDPNAQAQKAMLLSICWASAMNLALESNVIAGVVYDQQSNWLKGDTTVDQIKWSYSQAHNDKLLIGWISAKGIAATAGNVDLNFIEVYDQYSSNYPYYDSLALETISTVVGAPTACNNGLCAYETSKAPSSKIFPGIQYDFPYTDKNGKSAYAGAVGANIYQCAISQNLTADSCTNYASIVETSQPPSVQVMQALNYIWNAPSPPPANVSHFGGKNYYSGNVIYLFSTQYIGPQKSYFASSTITSKSQCADPSAPPNSCSCIASLYSPNAFCGAENGFGSWGNYLPEFISFTKLFLSSQGGNYCPGNSCSAGIYMYDFIPQAWYSQ
jgi:hypothetical protein